MDDCTTKSPVGLNPASRGPLDAHFAGLQVVLKAGPELEPLDMQTALRMMVTPAHAVPQSPQDPGRLACLALSATQMRPKYHVP